MTARTALAAVAMMLLLAAHPACAEDGLFGTWHDATARNAPVNRMHVTPNDIRFGKSLLYKASPVGPFATGTLFRVTGVNRAKDPFGCGLTHRITYLILRPLPADPSLPGPTAIRVYFYSGANAPTEQGIDNDLALCAIRPYRR